MLKESLKILDVKLWVLKICVIFILEFYLLRIIRDPFRLRKKLNSHTIPMQGAIRIFYFDFELELSDDYPGVGDIVTVVGNPTVEQLALFNQVDSLRNGNVLRKNGSFVFDFDFDPQIVC